MHLPIKQLARYIKKPLFRGVNKILLNFTEVGYINSTGIALIVRLLAESRKNGISVLTYGLSSHYLEIFEITRLADFMTIFSG